MSDKREIKFEQTDETKKCTIDNLHPNWQEYELSDEMKLDNNDIILKEIEVLKRK